MKKFLSFLVLSLLVLIGVQVATATISNPPSSVSTPVSIANGGTALTTTPTYGQLLVGNGTGYTLSATSTLGIALSDTIGTLAVTKGGTGQTSFGQGWLNSNGTTITASTSPTVNYVVATSTTQASAFVGVKAGTKVNTDGATITVDWLQGPTQEVVLGATGRTLAFSNVQPGAALKLWVWQDGTGSRTITTYPTGTHWAGGTAPTLTTTANKFDILVFTTASSTTQFSAGASLNY